MIPKSGYRFSEKDHAPANQSMIPKSGHRFSEKDHAPAKRQSGMMIQRKIIPLAARCSSAAAT
jgi:hypothetical protein